MDEKAEIKTAITAQGDQIKTFMVSKGGGDETDGFDKTDKQVEIYCDPATAAILDTRSARPTRCALFLP